VLVIALCISAHGLFWWWRSQVDKRKVGEKVSHGRIEGSEGDTTYGFWKSGFQGRKSMDFFKSVSPSVRLSADGLFLFSSNPLSSTKTNPILWSIVHSPSSIHSLTQPTALLIPSSFPQMKRIPYTDCSSRLSRPGSENKLTIVKMG